MTRDTPAPGLVVHQPRRGFRYGSEAFWLVGFALDGGRPVTALDLGTGSGIMAFLLARLGVDALGIDARAEWAPLWERSLAESRVSGRIRLEVRDVLAPGLPRVDLVVSNPPYFAATAPTAPDPWKAAARTESTATLPDFVRTGLAVAERACFVLPIEREAEALAVAGGAVRRVHVGKKRALVELRSGVSGSPEPQQIDERAETCRAWYRAATGLTATG